jgi:glucan 1,3-beta-glucosidase
MHASFALTAAILASGTAAAPTPGLISGLLSGVSGILGTLTGDLNTLLSSLGIKLHTDGNAHGPTLNYQGQCPFTFPVVTPSADRFSHDITWAKGVNGGQFLDWKTYKSNGANLGGWLEKEKTHDPIWWDSVGGADVPDGMFPVVLMCSLLTVF